MTASKRNPTLDFAREIIDPDFLRQRRVKNDRKYLTALVAPGWSELPPPNPYVDLRYIEEQVARQGRESSSLAAVLLEPDPKRGYVNPHPCVDLNYYAGVHADLRRSDLHPFVHFLTIGRKEGRSAHPLVDCQLLAKTCKKRPHGMPWFDYFAFHWQAEKQDFSLYLDWRFYAIAAGRTDFAGANPLVDYITSPFESRADAHPLFDGRAYLRTNPDVAAAGMDPLLHFLLYGFRENRQQNSCFHMPHFYGQSGLMQLYFGRHILERNQLAVGPEPSSKPAR